MTEAVNPDDPLASADPPRWRTWAAARAAADRVRRGGSITFESGPAANHHVPTELYIFSSDVGSREGARVATSVGSLVDRCH
jgi:hypothetical protein